MSTSISAQRVGDFTDAVASDAPTPGGGAVAGTVAAFGAALVGMAGRYAAQRDPASAVFATLVERSDRLRARAAALADADADAYGRYVEVSRSTVGQDTRRAALQAALDAAADVPFELGELAAEVADAGELLAVSGNPRLRADACAAALLGSAVAVSTALLVEENLHSRPDDPRVAGARDHAHSAMAAAERAVAAHGFLPDRTST